MCERKTVENGCYKSNGQVTIEISQFYKKHYISFAKINDSTVTLSLLI